MEPDNQEELPKNNEREHLTKAQLIERLEELEEELEHVRDRSRTKSELIEELESNEKRLSIKNQLLEINQENLINTLVSKMDNKG